MSSHKYAIGEVLFYVNDYGVFWGERRVVELSDPFRPGGEPRYYVETSSAPWFPIGESNLFATRKEAESAAAKRQRGKGEALSALLEEDALAGCFDDL